ncbi:hypothetical protein DFJ73DRAFT_861839 [Zopfochytrium polystomum]|nr:hypothetical protein DFJ73DRAFT_861839 [Zopfochytrium polystomum]
MEILLGVILAIAWPFWLASLFASFLIVLGGVPLLLLKLSLLVLQAFSRAVLRRLKRNAGLDSLRVPAAQRPVAATAAAPVSVPLTLAHAKSDAGLAHAQANRGEATHFSGPPLEINAFGNHPPLHSPTPSRPSPHHLLTGNPYASLGPEHHPRSPAAASGSTVSFPGGAAACIPGGAPASQLSMSHFQSDAHAPPLGDGLRYRANVGVGDGSSNRAKSFGPFDGSAGADPLLAQSGPPQFSVGGRFSPFSFPLPGAPAPGGGMYSAGSVTNGETASGSARLNSDHSQLAPLSSSPQPTHPFLREFSQSARQHYAQQPHGLSQSPERNFSSSALRPSFQAAKDRGAAVSGLQPTAGGQGQLEARDFELESNSNYLGEAPQSRMVYIDSRQGYSRDLRAQDRRPFFVSHSPSSVSHVLPVSLQNAGLGVLNVVIGGTSAFQERQGLGGGARSQSPNQNNVVVISGTEKIHEAEPGNAPSAGPHREQSALQDSRLVGLGPERRAGGPTSPEWEKNRVEEAAQLLSLLSAEDEEDDEDDFERSESPRPSVSSMDGSVTSHSRFTDVGLSASPASRRPFFDQYGSRSSSVREQPVGHTGNRLGPPGLSYQPWIVGVSPSWSRSETAISVENFVEALQELESLNGDGVTYHDAGSDYSGRSGNGLEGMGEHGTPSSSSQRAAVGRQRGSSAPSDPVRVLSSEEHARQS